MIKPNFFIIGAPKCGTTALSEYLRGHPDVYMSVIKEPGYFASDLPGLQLVSDKGGYEKLFQEATIKQSIAIGEASPSYLLSKNAVKQMHQYNPDSKLIIMLRNPLDVLLSYHSQLVFSLFENENNLSIAWKLQKDRMVGRKIPASCREAGLLQYRDVISFGSQIARVYSVFPEEQVMIILFEEFCEDTKKIYENVLSFLNVPSDNRSVFPVVNSAKEARFYWLNRLLHARSSKNALNHMQKIINVQLLKGFIHLHSLLKSFNIRKAPPNKLPTNVRKQILDEIYPDICLLEDVLNMDLGKWKS